MSDRMFSDCCYGTKHQHLPTDPCPQETRKLDDLDRLNPRYLLAVAKLGFERKARDEA